ncbi:CARDB domain-containing protein [Streptomyces sp. NPDC057638]|uniref:COG1361 S-layer family protein n=1 Tax=Streptomyces sp. NPDC057638 TaxID=3346190 RepID=UPI0036C1652D
MRWTRCRRGTVRAVVGALLCAVPLCGGPGPALALPRAMAPAEVISHLSRAPGQAETPPGSLVTYTLTARNNGPSLAREVTATDTLPEGMEFVSSADGCTASGRTITCGPWPQLTVGETKNWSFVVQLSPSYQGDGSDLGNTATGTSEAIDPDPGNNKTDPVSPVGPFDPVSDLRTVKTPLGDGPIVPGQEYEYQVTTENRGPSDARNVTITDTLPDGITFVSSADPCTAAGQRVTCGPLAVLEPHAKVSWTFRVRLSESYTGDGSDLDNTATSTSDSTDPHPEDNTSPPVRPPGGVSEPQADLWTAKRPATSTPVSPGETFDYVVTVTNDGPSRAVNARITDTLPSQLAFVSSADGCTAAGQTVSCGPQPVLMPTAAKTWRFTVRLDPNYRGDGSDIQNTATVTSDTEDPVPGNNTSPPAGLPGSAVNQPYADLSVTKTAVGDTPLSPGQSFDYRIRITNNGPSADAANVRLIDNLPQGLIYVSSSPAGCTVSGHVVSCRRSTPLQVGESADYSLTVRIDPAYTGDGSDLVNTARVTADNIDPTSENDTDTATVPGGNVAAPSADLGIVKKPVTNTPVAPGETFEYSLTVTNQGPSQATDVTVSDVLPTALSFVSSDDTCMSGTTVDCGPLPTLAPGASYTWVFRVKVDPEYDGDGSDIRNRATVDSATADPAEANNTSIAGPPGGTVNRPTADLEVTKKTP